MPEISVIEAQEKLTLANARTFPQALKEFANDMAAVIAKEATAEGKLATLIAAKAIELAQRPTRYWSQRVIFTPDIDQERLGDGTVIIRLSLRVSGPGAKYYWFVNLGTRPHIIKPRSRKVLLIRGYKPKTRPVALAGPGGEPSAGEGRLQQYRRTSEMIGSRWVTAKTEPARALRGYKGRYYSVTWLKTKGRAGKHYCFAHSVKQSIRPRYFLQLIGEALNTIVPKEMAKFGKDLKAVLGNRVRFECRIKG